LADDAVERCYDLSVTELELRRGEQCLGSLQLGGALLLRSLQNLKLVLLRRDQCAAGTDVRLRLRVCGDGLLKPLPCAGIGPRQHLLPFLLLPGFDLQSLRRHARGFRLCNRGILQFDLVFQILQHRLRAVDVGISLIDLSLIVRWINLHQQVATLDALKIIDRNI